jgi:3-phosphoshikimate 1-carboxyvinyltransferase
VAADVDARLSGTTSRFLLPLLALGAGRYQLDGAPSLRTRPLTPLLDALRSLGAHVEGDHLPVTIGGPVRGGHVAVPGDLSSQFLSGLLLAGPAMPDGLTVDLTTDLVSKPYVTMTTAVMEAFGAEIDGLAVAPTGYRGRRYAVEPDASAASYFFAAAAITGGRVTVPGLGTASLQGDLGFVDVLAAMGATVERGPGGTTVVGGPLHGVDVDLADLSDTAQTLAAVAVFADSPTRVRGIGFVRGKETDRIGAVVTELRRCGIDAEETDDGFVVRPGTPSPARIRTYDDHRMAMSFALLGLRVPGIEIDDPEVVAKTFPGYWDAVSGLRAGGR